MKALVRITTIVLACVLAGCGTTEDGSADATTSATASPDSPSPAATNDVPQEPTDLVGDWEDPAEEWMVHFKDDGTFVEDYQGVENFRVGQYSIDGSTVRLEGGDGNTDEGTVDGETLKFKLGTLERVEQ